MYAFSKASKSEDRTRRTSLSNISGSVTANRREADRGRDEECIEDGGAKAPTQDKAESAMRASAHREKLEYTGEDDDLAVAIMKASSGCVVV